jgi:hypothetical protein
MDFHILRRAPLRGRSQVILGVGVGQEAIFQKSLAADDEARSGEQQNEASARSKQQTTTNNVATSGLLMIGCALSDKMIVLKSELAS